MARKDEEVRKLTDEFVRVRVVRMQGVDFNLFQFDFDLTWAAFFMNAHGHVYARYGARKDRNPEGLMSVEGFKAVARKALEIHGTEKDVKPEPAAPKTHESLRSLPANLKSGKNCMHCHQVFDYLRKDDPGFDRRQATEVYPLPDNLGMTFDPALGNVVASVDPRGAAAKAGVKAKDAVVAINGVRVLSAGDASWALHNAAKADPIKVQLARGAERREVSVAPPPDWRVRDISWRGSMWPLKPSPGFGGRPLNAADLQKAGLKPGSFAFRIDYLVTWGDEAARGNNAIKAGLRKGDVVVGVGGKRDFASELHFQSWFRLTQRPGTEIEFEVLRGGQVVKVRLPIL